MQREVYDEGWCLAKQLAAAGGDGCFFFCRLLGVSPLLLCTYYGKWTRFLHVPCSRRPGIGLSRLAEMYPSAGWQLWLAAISYGLWCSRIVCGAWWVASSFTEDQGHLRLRSQKVGGAIYMFCGCDVVLPIARGTGDVIAHAAVGATPSGDAYSRIMGVRGWGGGGLLRVRAFRSP